MANGTLTSTVPSSDKTIVIVGICVRSHATEGVLYVRIQEIPYIDEHSGVDTTGKINNSILVWNTTAWIDSTTPTFDNVTADVFYGDVKIDTMNGQTYHYLQDWIDTTQSAGKVT